MEILAKIILSFSFAGAVFFIAGGITHSINSIVNKVDRDVTLNWLFGCGCLAILFFEYAP
jgi:hypothetical protein